MNNQAACCHMRAAVQHILKGKECWQDMNSKGNTIAATVFLIFGILILSESFKIRLLKFGSALGGDFFPKVLSISLIILSSIWLVLSFRQFMRQRKNNEKLKNRFVLTRPILFIVVFVIYIITLKWLGFTIPTIALVFVNYLLLKDRFRYMDFLIGSGYSLAVTILIWFLFTKILGLVLPMGIL